MRGYAIGDRVSQPQYGTGTIRLVDEYHTVIDFDDHGIRRFATSMVKLERSSTVDDRSSLTIDVEKRRMPCSSKSITV